MTRLKNRSKSCIKIALSNKDGEQKCLGYYYDQIPVELIRYASHNIKDVTILCAGISAYSIGGDIDQLIHIQKEIEDRNTEKRVTSIVKESDIEPEQETIPTMELRTVEDFDYKYSIDEEFWLNYGLEVDYIDITDEVDIKEIHRMISEDPYMAKEIRKGYLILNKSNGACIFKTNNDLWIYDSETQAFCSLVTADKGFNRLIPDEDIAVVTLYGDYTLNLSQSDPLFKKFTDRCMVIRENIAKATNNNPVVGE